MLLLLQFYKHKHNETAVWNINIYGYLTILTEIIHSIYSIYSKKI